VLAKQLGRGSTANLTLTIAALALRAAEKIKMELAGRK
jgi:hypothetical protein